MGSTLSSGRITARRRRKTTSAANVDYHELNGNDVTDYLMTSSQQSSKVGRAKRASRLLTVLTGRKTAAVATCPADGDVISSNGAHCWHQQKKSSEYNEVLCGPFIYYWYYYYYYYSTTIVVVVIISQSS